MLSLLFLYSFQVLTLSEYESQCNFWKVHVPFLFAVDFFIYCYAFLLLINVLWAVIN